MMRLSAWSVLLLLADRGVVDGFVAKNSPAAVGNSYRRQSFVSELRVLKDHNNEPSFEQDEFGDDFDSTTAWNLPNDFGTFLNQCSIQSFAYLLKSLRDPQTVLYIENFTQPAISQRKKPSFATEPVGGSSESKLLTYHGLGAMNTTLFPTWDVYFGKLLEQPEESYRIVSDSPYIPNYDLEIKPASLCSRMISIREQIAREFVRDLNVIADMGGHTLDRYWDSLKKQKQEDETCDPDGGSGGLLLQRENLMFLDLGADEQSDQKPSPLRKGNFDLLVLLATQESIHRVLNDDDEDPEQVISSNFLRNFYAQRLDSHFTGSQRYGRADDFIEELLSEAPRMVQGPNGATALIDPIRIAELLLIERELVALEWAEQAEAVPRDHMQIKRMQLNLLMGIPANATAK